MPIRSEGMTNGTRRVRPARRVWMGVAFSFLAGGLASATSAAAPRTAAPTSPGGRYVFRVYGEEDGLSNLTVECLLQDRTGFLWVGTQDGLFRFDGRRFARFGRDEGLPSTRINCLHQAPDGTLFAGTRAGVARLEKDRFVALGEKEGLPPDPIPDEGIVSSPKGDLFVATPRGLYSRAASASSFRRENPSGSGVAQATGGLHFAGDGSLYFGISGALYRRDPAGRFENYGGTHGLADLGQIDETATDRDGRLWVRTLKALSVLAPRTTSFLRADVGLPASVSVGRLALDDLGAVMLPTERGLARRAGDRWRILGRAQGLETETVLSSLVDREGSLWIGLAGLGLAQQLGRGAFTAWGTAEGLPHDVVWSIVRERSGAGRGALWVGTQEGIARFDTESGAIRSWKEKDGLGGNTVYGLAATPDGSVWAGSWPGGVTRFGPEANRMRHYAASDQALAEFRVTSVYLAKNGDLWAGARSGAYRLAAGYAGDRFEKVRQPPEGEDPDSVYGFAEDSQGAVWAAGRFGVERLTGAEPRRWRKKDGLQADFLASIVAMPDGAIVAGYREALGGERFAFANGKLDLYHLRRATGLTADKVILLGRDAAGSLWVGGGSGLDAFRGGLFARPIHFGRAGGLASEDMDQNAFFAEPDGTIWVGTSRGLVRYEQGPDSAARTKPPIVLTDLEAGERRLDPSLPARLSRRERNLRIAWAGLTFVDPKRVRYRYRLAGLEDTLIETTLTEARFASLPSGRYRFEVVAVGADEEASEKPATFSFVVLPAWWEMWWAKIAAVVLAGLAVFGVVRMRTRALEADRRRLEAAVEAGRAELAAANRELEEASFTDPLTGLRNRRYFSVLIGPEVLRTLRAYSGAAGNPPPGHRDLIFYVIDLDDFKAVNDLYGHDAGDRVLVETARRLVSVARQSDLVVRWGGEEFLLVSRDADRGEAQALAARLLDVIGKTPFDAGEGREAKLTCSVGWAPFPWSAREPSSRSHEEVLKVADRALYLAKEAGRNRAVGSLPSASGAPSTHEAGGLRFDVEVLTGPL